MKLPVSVANRGEYDDVPSYIYWTKPAISYLAATSVFKMDEYTFNESPIKLTRKSVKLILKILPLEVEAAHHTLALSS